MATVPVKYIGPKVGKHDTLTGSGLVWNPGQTHLMDEEKARRLLRHPDAWVLGEGAELPPEKVESKKPENDVVLPSPLPRLEPLSKDKLVQLARTRFGETMDPTMKSGDMRARIQALENAGRARGV